MSLIAPNPRLQRTPSPPSPLSRHPLGGAKSWKSARSQLVVGILLLAGNIQARASIPLGPEPFPDEEVLLLLDMGAGQVRDETIDTVVQGLLQRDFGGHFQMAIVLGWATRDGLVPESSVRRALSRYGCDQFAARSSLACRFTLEAFSYGVGFGWSERPKSSAPECLGDGADLFYGEGYESLSQAVYRSIGDPELVLLARSLPGSTLDDVEHPKGIVVINGPADNRLLFCTLHAWRGFDRTPDRWVAYLEYLRCRAK